MFVYIYLNVRPTLPFLSTIPTTYFILRTVTCRKSDSNLLILIRQVYRRPRFGYIRNVGTVGQTLQWQLGVEGGGGGVKTGSSTAGGGPVFCAAPNLARSLQ